MRQTLQIAIHFHQLNNMLSQITSGKGPYSSSDFTLARDRGSVSPSAKKTRKVREVCSSPS